MDIPPEDQAQDAAHTVEMGAQAESEDASIQAQEYRSGREEEFDWDVGLLWDL